MWAINIIKDFQTEYTVAGSLEKQLVGVKCVFLLSDIKLMWLIILENCSLHEFINLVKVRPCKIALGIVPGE